MTRRTDPLATLVAAALAAGGAGCQAVEAPRPADGPPVEALTDTEQAVADLAVATLAEDLKIPKDAITVESVTEVDWRSSALGCPKPGMVYLDVISSGHKVTLRANGELYYVHEADNKAFVCRQPSLGGVLPQGELAYGRPMLTAQRDLARRLGVAVTEIRPGGATRMTWENAALGCPQPGMHYAEVETHGWRLTLKHGEREYTYHADDHHVIPCPDITAE